MNTKMDGGLEILDTLKAEAGVGFGNDYEIVLRWMRDVATPAEIGRRFWWLYVGNQSPLNNQQPAGDPDKGGFWAFFVPLDELNRKWDMLKHATMSGQLGWMSRVKTTKPDLHVSYDDEDTKPICVHTYDYTDHKDTYRVAKQLRLLGIEEELKYKTDEDSKNGVLSKCGHRNISIERYLRGQPVVNQEDLLNLY